MSFLTDTDLRRIISEDKNDSNTSKLIIYPFDEGWLTPVGYDLRVGSQYSTSERPGNKTLHEGESLILAPKSTGLITTLEYIRMPQSRAYSGMIASKVTKVSRGLSHISTTVDPDWQGNLLIAVHNHSENNVKLKYGEAFCTIVFLKNLSPSSKNSNKPPKRIDVLLDKFNRESQQADRQRKWKSLIPPGIIILISAIGYLLFGNNVGFSAMVVLGVAISQFASESLK